MGRVAKTADAVQPPWLRPTEWSAAAPMQNRCSRYAPSFRRKGWSVSRGSPFSLITLMSFFFPFSFWVCSKRKLRSSFNGWWGWWWLRLDRWRTVWLFIGVCFSLTRRKIFNCYLKQGLRNYFVAMKCDKQSQRYRSTTFWICLLQFIKLFLFLRLAADLIGIII